METICKICGRKFATWKGFGYHVHLGHNISCAEYYKKYIDTSKNVGKCLACGKPTPFLTLREGFQKYCCAKCGGAGSSKQGKETMLRRYGKKGVNNPELTKKLAAERTQEQKDEDRKNWETSIIKHYGSLENYYDWRSKKAISSRKDKIRQFETEHDCTMLYTVVRQYGQGWYKAKIVEPFYKDRNNILYIKNEDVEKIINYREINKNHQKSHEEEDFKNFIKTCYHGPIVENTRKILGRHLELDLYLPELKLAFEYNGTIWHSTIMRHPKNAHELKSKLAAEKGIRLIHVYEYEWLDIEKRHKVESLIKIALGNYQTKLFARKCLVKQIDDKEKIKDFENRNHLQGYRGGQITYGLFYDDRLVQLMSFSKTKYNKNLTEENSWEIMRECSDQNTIVVGGVERLFRHFVDDFNPKCVFSYCDFNKFDGKSYEKIGMKLVGYTGPDMKWVLPGNIVAGRNPKRHSELKAIAQGQIWGAGSKKYLWINQKQLLNINSGK